MLRDRYDPMNLFDLIPALSLAMDPILAQLDQLLEDDGLFQRVKPTCCAAPPIPLPVDGRRRR